MNFKKYLKENYSYFVEDLDLDFGAPPPDTVIDEPVNVQKPTQNNTRAGINFYGQTIYPHTPNIPNIMKSKMSDLRNKIQKYFIKHLTTIKDSTINQTMNRLYSRRGMLGPLVSPEMSQQRDNNSLLKIFLLEEIYAVYMNLIAKSKSFRSSPEFSYIENVGPFVGSSTPYDMKGLEFMVVLLNPIVDKFFDPQVLDKRSDIREMRKNIRQRVIDSYKKQVENAQKKAANK
jgi:hypothetical protein